jgi:hypothetical protein
LNPLSSKCKPQRDGVRSAASKIARASNGAAFVCAAALVTFTLSGAQFLCSQKAKQNGK